jgi:hypothetical protein
MYILQYLQYLSREDSYWVQLQERRTLLALKGLIHEYAGYLLN